MSSSIRRLQAVSQTPGFTIKIQSIIILDDYNEEIEPYTDSAVDKRHAFLASSARGNINIKETIFRKKQRKERVFVVDLQIAIRTILEAFIRGLEADIISTIQHIRVLYQIRTERLSRQEQSLEHFWLTKSLVKMQESSVVLQEQKHQLVGEWADEIIHFRRKRGIGDWFYIEELVRRQKNPRRARLLLFRDREQPTEQSLHQEEVFEAYGMQVSITGERHVFCCIHGGWMPHSDMTVVRLVPHALGEENAAHLFGRPGERKGNLMRCSIALPIPRMYANIIRRGRLVFLPLYNSNDIRIVSLDRKLNVLYAHLVGNILIFQNAFRPDREYLCFAVAVAVMNHYRDGLTTGDGWWKWFAKLELKWTLPRDSPRKLCLWAMAVRFAHMSKEDVSKFLRMEGIRFPCSEPNDRDKLIADYVAVWMQRQLRAYRGLLNEWDEYCRLCGQFQEW